MTNQHPNGTSYSGEHSKNITIINKGVLYILRSEGDLHFQSNDTKIEIQNAKNIVRSFWEEVKELDIPEKQDLEETIKEINDSDDKVYIQSCLERLMDYLRRNATRIGNLAFMWGTKLVELHNRLKNG